MTKLSTPEYSYSAFLDIDTDGFGHAGLTLIKREGDYPVEAHSCEISGNSYRIQVLENSPTLKKIYKKTSKSSLAVFLLNAYFIPQILIGGIKFSLEKITCPFKKHATLEIPLDETQYANILKDMTEGLNSGQYHYQILGLGKGSHNCVSVLTNMLERSGIVIDNYVPPLSWTDRIDSPQSLALRLLAHKDKPCVSIDDTISPESTWLLRLTERARKTERQISSICYD